jgi:hypothetical protein
MSSNLSALTRPLGNISRAVSHCRGAYNFKRVMQMKGVRPLIQAIRAG